MFKCLVLLSNQQTFYFLLQTVQGIWLYLENMIVVTIRIILMELKAVTSPDIFYNEKKLPFTVLY